MNREGQAVHQIEAEIAKPQGAFYAKAAGR